MIIGRKLKKKIMSALRSGEEIPDDLIQEIKSKNPDSSDQEIKDYLSTEFEEKQKDKEFLTLETDITKLLRNTFSYNNDKLEVADLKDSNFNSSLVKLQVGMRSNIPNVIVNLEKYIEMSPDANTSNNLEDLIKRINYLNKEQSGKTSSKQIKTKLYLSWAREIGDLPLGDWSNRKAIYEYWSSIDNKEKKALDDAFATLKNKYKDSDLWKEIKTSKRGDKYYRLNELFTFETPPSYIVDLGSVGIKMRAPNTLLTALRIIEYYNKIRTGSDPSLKFEDIKIQEGDFKRLDVDPIFYYKYHRDYEDIVIPKSEVSKVRELVKTSPLKYAAFTDAELEDFDNWFDGFIEETQEDEQYNGTFSLPISDWVINVGKDYVDENVDITEQDELVKAFIEDVGEYLEDKKTKFSIFQERSEVNLEPTASQYQTAQRLRRLGRATQQPATMGTPSKELARFETQEDGQYEAPWNDFLKAMDSYYISPISSKYFFSPKELPRWANSHTAYMIAIKNEENNPIGYLLGKTIEGSLDDIIDLRQLKALTNFILAVKRSGAKTWDNKYFFNGRMAVLALNSLFGDRFKEKNMQSVGYIIYDMAKKSRYSDEDISEMVKKYPFWKDIKEHYDNYLKSQGEIYPIEQLRYAINTPEFTTMFGSLDKDSGGLSVKDKDMYKELKRLDSAFDDFYKMDEINQVMLEAHDTIRKMNNEPIYHANLSLNSIEDMDLIINKLHLEQSMELTATEVDKIVKAVSSYESIAANFGINEESVYTIKALFR